MSRPRILIVEDEILIAIDLQARLEEAGFDSVGIAVDTFAAMSLAGEHPDLALVDVNLRDGPTGPEIARRLSEDFHIPVLFVTANPRMAMESAHWGIGILAKPCDDGALKAALDYALAGERSMSPPSGLTILN